MTEDKTKARQCHHVGCDSGARWGVLLHLNCVAPGVVVATHMKSGIEVCDTHKDDKLLRDYILSNENRERITTWLMEQGGHPEPDFLTARIEFFAIERSVVHAQPAIPKPQCDRSDCADLATHQVKLAFRMRYQRGKGQPIIDYLTNRVVCGKHAMMTDKTAFRDAGDLEFIRQSFAKRGLVGADFNNVEVAFISLDGAERDPRTGLIDRAKWVGEGQPYDLNPGFQLGSKQPAKPADTPVH